MLENGGLLEVKMPDGSTWRVSLYVIGLLRIKYYTVEIGLSEENAQNLAQRDILLGSLAFEDWLSNKVKWEDVKAFIRLTDAGSDKYVKGWQRAEKTFVRNK